MSTRRRVATRSLLSLLLIGTSSLAAQSPRTVEVVRRDCQTTAVGQEITLFANGTLRLRHRLQTEESLKLTELDPPDRDALIRRMSEEDLSEVDEGRAEVRGDLVEACRIELRLPERQARVFRFGRFDSLPLALARLNAILDEMVELAEERSPSSGLPRDYRPQPGDVLERADGEHFRVIGWTGDGGGLELAGVETPLILFVAYEDLGREFVSIVSRRRWP